MPRVRVRLKLILLQILLNIAGSSRDLESTARAGFKLAFFEPIARGAALQRVAFRLLHLSSTPAGFAAMSGKEPTKLVWKKKESPDKSPAKSPEKSPSKSHEKEAAKSGGGVSSGFASSSASPNGLFSAAASGVGGPTPPKQAETPPKAQPVTKSGTSDGLRSSPRKVHESFFFQY